MSDLESARGRQPVVSTGRGGAGNLIRSPSRGVDPETTPGIELGREVRDGSHDRVTHSGRGGAGNVRSPSRPRDVIAEAREDALQDQLVADRRGRQAEAPFSTGRGGAGNIARSKSRSRSAVRDHHEHHDLHGVGRGGFGNIVEDRPQTPVDLQKEAAVRRYEADIAARHSAEEEVAPHSTGKGGAGNIGRPVTHVDMSTLTQEERDAYAKVHEHDVERGYTVGKGGAGNFIHPSKEHSPADGERGREKHGMLGNVLRSLSRAAGRDKSETRAKD
ncbi:hypothetical protein BCR39DRAFT_472749 [Naematelia encephala]|uniref:Uncharacterized protein n=1 Tax=Naematelia encephala TaxID=71784 RepID=A0A1Y2ANZ2_9TREE|nr:hypothetical protein BCR39DRAFT_472749 [Naematelia encephala]